MSDQDRPSLTERPIRVLVVDDDETFRFVMERRLRGSGHHVECVGCGEAALDRLASTAFDVILLDLAVTWSVQAWTHTSELGAVRQALLAGIKNGLGGLGIPPPRPAMEVHMPGIADIAKLAGRSEGLTSVGRS